MFCKRLQQYVSYVLVSLGMAALDTLEMANLISLTITWQAVWKNVVRCIRGHHVSLGNKPIAQSHHSFLPNPQS